jgi:hypothetical protein
MESGMGAEVGLDTVTETREEMIIEAETDREGGGVRDNGK